MPLILGPDGAKLSKRHGGVSVEDFIPVAPANTTWTSCFRTPSARNSASMKK
jgi:hypothetical protein